MKVPSEYLVLGIFGSIGAATYLGTRGSGKKQEQKPSVASVPLNAASAYVS